MKILSSKLTHLPVETKSGKNLGKVEKFSIETESQSILDYQIKPSNLVAGLIQNNLLISRGQVLDITAKKMVVDDNLVLEKKPIKLKKAVKHKEIAGALMLKK